MKSYDFDLPLSNTTVTTAVKVNRSFGSREYIASFNFIDGHGCVLDVQEYAVGLPWSKALEAHFSYLPGQELENDEVGRVVKLPEITVPAGVAKLRLHLAEWGNRKGEPGVPVTTAALETMIVNRPSIILGQES